MKLFISLLTTFLLISCGSDDDGGTTLNSNGTAVNKISSAMGSISDLANSSLLFLQPRILGGVATSYCSSTGGPLISGTPVGTGDDEYAGGVAFCQATFNAQSPDTARGAMYIAGGLTCEAARLGLFGTGTNTATSDVTINTTCWGSEAEVDAFVDDNGMSVLEDVSFTVEELSSGYDYKVTYQLSGESADSVYIKTSDNVTAALSTDGWFVKMDATNGIVQYEGIDTDNERRVRLLVEGTLSGGSFTSIDSIEGFHNQANSGTFSNFVIYQGNVTVGFMGNVYDGGAGNLGKCYLHGGTAGTCSGFTGISSSNAEAQAMITSISTDRSNLTSSNSSVLDITEIDPSDTDITQ